MNTLTCEGPVAGSLSSLDNSALGFEMQEFMRVEGFGFGFWLQGFGIGEFPKIRGTLFWGPYNKDPTT